MGNQPKQLAKYQTCLMAILLTLAAVPGMAFAGGEAPPFDFSDAFYLQNGIDPAKLRGRVNGMDGVSVQDTSDDPTRNDIRVLETTGGFNATGNVIYYNVFSMMMPDTFTNDEAGRRAMEIANHYRAFIFPKAGGDPLSPMPSNRRQDNLFDTRNGYFSNNPLGLWVLTFVHYTDKALNTVEGQKILAQLAEKNGVDLDGTPVLKSASDIDGLAALGFLELRTRALDGSQGVPWVV
jgi:hypothetical protein